MLQSLVPEQRAQVEAEMARQRRQTFQGTCPGAMKHRQSILSADQSFAAVLTEFQKVGGRQLAIVLLYPPAKYSWHTPSNLGSESLGHQIANYIFNVDGSGPSSIHLEFGFRRNDIIRALAVPMGFLVLPIIIVLWMRRAALTRAKEDPTAAWFGYMRVLNWCVLVAFLLWLVAHSFRQGLEDVAAYNLAGHGAAAAALRVAILLLPPWLVYAICLTSSYAVYFHVRGERWTRREFLLNQLLQVAVQLLPLMLLFAGVEMLWTNRRVSMALFASVYFVVVLCARLKMKVAGTHPVALTTGELRDRVFELAKRAAIELRQIFILPAGKSQLANAFASRNRTVLFTDYLLDRLNKREVSAVAAHEIAHLQKHHIFWRMMALMGLVVSPFLLGALLDYGLGLLSVAVNMTGSAGAEKVARIVKSVQGFSEIDLVYYAVGLTLFYLHSRYVEKAADAGAVRLTGDPEAVITGLLKIGRLNLLPVQWGRATGAMLTHPSTLRRVQRVARIGQVSPERLQTILENYRQLERQPLTNDLGQGEDKFSNAQVPPDRVLASARATQSALTKLWMLLFLNIGLPVTVAWLIHDLQLRWTASAYIGGAVATVVLYSLMAHWVGWLWGRKKTQREFQLKLAAEGMPVDHQATFVGLSPHAGPRFYVSDNNWDKGYLFFLRDRLCYFGEQVRFALMPSQIRHVRLGSGKPGWFPVPRTYLEWVDESGVIRTWNIVPMGSCSFWSVRQQARQLCAAVQRWMRQPAESAELPAVLAQLRAPCVGEVTSRSFKSLVAPGRWLRHALMILLLAIMTCIALNVPNVLYVCFLVLLLRLYEGLPFWLYKEPWEAVPQSHTEPVPVAKA